MEVRILGSLEVLSDVGEPVPVSQPLIRSAVCVLVLKHGQFLTSAQLMDLLWEPGASGRTAGAVKTCISGVRRVLTPHRVPPGHRGYRLLLQDEDHTDLIAFRDLSGQAREADARGDLPLAAELYQRGLGLWRDPPVADVPRTPAMSGTVAGLLGERRTAREELTRIRLLLGEHRELVPALQRWVDEEPLNEHLWAQLLLALYRSGRRAQALQLYDDAHDVLVRETATEPGPELQRMWHRIKVADPELLDEPAPQTEIGGATSSPSAQSPLARQLPPDVRDFTGRDSERGRIRSLLTSAAEATAPPIVQITGIPGVGKTCLALHVAHAAAGSFPDGQLYLQLAGASPASRHPAVVLNEVLRAIGVAPAEIPDTLDERAALYRSRLAGRRVLVVADDAAGPEQIRPLLPGSAGCAIIVTSRVWTLGLDGAHLLDLQRLPHSDAVRMLGRVVGRDRVLAERGDAERIVSACDGLPLALRIVGARLATRPAWPLAHMAGLLLERSHRLDHLVSGDAAVRAHIKASYDSLDGRAQAAFRMLALAGPHDVAPWVVDVLLGDPHSAEVIDDLVDKSLLTATGVDPLGTPRYRFHDLLREYAAEQLRDDPAAEPALERLTVAWLELADAADARVPRDPYFPAPARFDERIAVSDTLVRDLVETDPVAWFETELANLRNAVRVACKAGRFRLATGLVLRMASHLHLHHRHDEAEHLWRTVAESAEAAGDIEAAARTRFRAAVVMAADRGRPAEALPMLDECVEVFERSNSTRECARALSLRAYSAQRLGRMEPARQDAERGLGLARELNDPHAVFGCLRVLGLVLSQQGHHAQAAEASEEAVLIARGLGEAAYHGIALYSLVRVHLTAGHYDRLPAFCEEGLRLTESIGHVLGTAYFLEQWGYAHQGLGEHEQAVARLTRAADLFASQEAVAPGAACRLRLADSHRALGQYDQARVQLEWCLSAYGELGQTEDEKRARDALADLDIQ